MSLVRHVLCRDGALRLEAPDAPLPALDRWLPRFLDGDADAEDADAAVISVRHGARTGVPRPAGAPTFSLDTVGAWVRGGRVRLAGGEPGCGGRLLLECRRARIRVPERPTPDAAAELFTLLTVSAALLLGRLGRALVHAAAVTDPAGRAWLLVGDTHAGKTTTTINLVRGGWGFLSDDHVVAFPGPGGVEIEGWPRPFHVDEGWSRGEVTGRRAAVEPATFGAERWTRTAPLGGLIFPRVDAVAPTRLEPLAAAAALAALIRQTPWLMTDRGAAPAVLPLLREMSTRPAYSLSVGLDTYADPALLAVRCAPAG
jgi:hypothetical protein